MQREVERYFRRITEAEDTAIRNRAASLRKVGRGGTTGAHHSYQLAARRRAHLRKLSKISARTSLALRFPVNSGVGEAVP